MPSAITKTNKKHQDRALGVYLKLARAESTISSQSTKSLTGSGLSLGQFGILETLFHHGPLPQKELSAKHLSSEANITQLLNKLSTKKLIQRKRRKEDRRSLEIHLTKTGEKKVRELMPRFTKNVTSMMSVLSSTEQNQLAALLKKLGTSVQDIDITN